MENTNSMEQEKFGILFIYEHDGLEWTKYMMGVLQAEPYKIRCLSALCWDLNQKTIEKCSVLALVLTPEMENKSSSLSLHLLKPHSVNSCVIECNGLLSNTKLPKWNNMYTLEETSESQRAVLARLIDLFEEVTGNNDIINADTENVLIMDVVPAILYPGQKEVYVMFNYEEKDDVTVSVEGVTDRIRTRKCTKTVHIFDMPDTPPGKKYLNIYVGNQVDPIFSTNIVVITPENLAESLTINLQRILSPRNSQDPRKKGEASSFDPFSEPQCTDATLKKCWSTMKDYLGTEIEATKPNTKHTGSKWFVAEDKSKVDEEETTAVLRKKTTPWNKMKDMFAKKFNGNDTTGYRVNTARRKSRRVVLAKNQNLQGRPNLPKK